MHDNLTKVAVRALLKSSKVIDLKKLCQKIVSINYKTLKEFFYA